MKTQQPRRLLPCHPLAMEFTPWLEVVLRFQSRTYSTTAVHVD